MSVRRLDSGLWVADVTMGRRLDGSRDRRTRQCRTKAEAERAERAWLVEKERARGKSYGRIALAEFVADFFWPQKTRLKGSTVKGYKRDLDLRILPALGGMAMEDIGRLQIQRMLMSCPTRKTATNARETLSSVMSLAVEMGVVPVNPAGFRYEYPAASRPDPEALGVWLTSFEKIGRVVDWVHRGWEGAPEERMVVLGLLFGLRKGEVLGLDAADIDIAGRKIGIRRAYTEGEHGPELGPPKTPKAVRDVPMMHRAREIMEGWDLPDGPVVRGLDGGRMNPSTARGRLQKVFGEGARFDDGTPVPRMTQFSMRHSFGTSCITAGIEVSKLSRWMGHVDVTTTLNRYVKHRIADLYEDADIIDAALG